MQQLAANQANAHIVVNENFATLEWASVYGNDPDIISALHRGYLGGRHGGFDFTAVDHAFGVSTTTYVSKVLADGTLNFSTSSTNYNDATNYAKVETVVTSASAVTSVIDDRGGPGGVHGGGGSVGGSGDLLAANNLSDVENAATARTNLGVDTAIAAAVSALVAAAPGALDTLDELAAALGDDASFAASVTTALAGKAPLSNTVTALSTSGTVNIDLSLGDYFTCALSGNVTSITFSNLPGSSKGASKWIQFTQDSTPRTVAWPASFKWAGAVAGAVSTGSGAIDELAITTVDNGTTWKATLGKAFA